MDIRQALAQGGPLVIDQNTTLTLEPITQGIKGLWSKWCIKEAWRETMAAAEDLPPDQADRMIGATAAQVNAGRFEFYGDLSLKRQQTVPGMLHLLWLRLKPHHPDMKESDLEKVLLDNNGKILRHIVAQIKAADADPTKAGQGDEMMRTVE